jgi:hypothetical protein
MISVVNAGLRSVQSWRIILVWVGFTLIPTAVVSLPLGSWLSEQLDHSAYAGAWAQNFNVTEVRELVVNATDIAPMLQSALVISLLLTVAVSPFLTGMVVASAREKQVLGFVALVQGGAREYGRMLRTLLWSLVPLGIAGALGAWALQSVDKRAETAILESQVSHEQLLAVILLMVLLIVAHVTVEAGRAQFALDLSRRSAIKAWWRGVRLMFARPAATLGSYILITAVGLILVVLLGIARIHSPHATICGFLFSLVLTELIAAAAIWMRIARLLTLIQIARAPASFTRE